MSITILGQNIRLIRPEKIHKHRLPAEVFKKDRIKGPKRIKRTLAELKGIAREMGYEFIQGA